MEEPYETIGGKKQFARKVEFADDVVFLRDSGISDEYRIRRKGATADRWYSSHNGSTALSTAVLVANKAYAMPIFFGQRVSVDWIAINVTSGTAGKARFGIYTDNGNCFPSTLVVGSAEVDTAASAVKTSDQSAAPIVLVPGMYWLAVVSNATPTLRGHVVAGTPPLLGLDNTLGTATGVGWVSDFTYAALPAVFPTTNATILAAAPLPAIFVRLM
jgi:hypothetical protein